MSLFPSVFSTFSQPTASSRLNNPSHSALENSQSSTIGQIQAIIGLADAASVPGTIISDLRSPNSKGGGHVQGAAFGGTGQTTYSKGQLLVASSASVLSKLAVGADNQVLQADSSQAAGVKWSAVLANKVFSSITSAQIAGTSILTTLFSASILANTLGTNNAIRFTGEIKKFNVDPNYNITFVVNYGNNSVLSSGAITPNYPTLGSPASGIINGIIMGVNSTTVQNATMEMKFGMNSKSTTLGSSVLNYFITGTSSVNSALAQDLIITAVTNFNGSGVSPSLLSGLFLVEKII